MLCPFCGEDLDDGATICSKCGKSTEAIKAPSGKKRGGRAIGATAIIMLAIVLAAVVLMSGGLNKAYEQNVNTDTNVYSSIYNGTVTPMSIDYPSNYSISISIEPSGAVDKNVFRFELKSFPSQMKYFRWILKDQDHSFYDAYVRDSTTGDFTCLVTKNIENAVYKYMEYNGSLIAAGSNTSVTAPASPGKYTVTVLMYTSESNYANNTAPKTYNTDFTCNGTIFKEYKWSYSMELSKKKEKTFALKFAYDYRDYYVYKNNSSLDRRPVVGNEDLFVKYVVVDERINGLSSMLSKVYRLAYGQDAALDGQRYADFLLTFVQINFTYPPNDLNKNGDTVIYNVVDRYAYPMEVLHRGTGDCEDTSALLASLYKASGFKTAMGMLPGHAIAGVALKGEYVPVMSDTDVASSKVTLEYSEMQVNNGYTYYACETTTESHMPLGYLMVRDVENLKDVHRFYPVP